MLREEAIPFITYNRGKVPQFELNEEAARILSKQTQPFGVVSVAGQYRTGKSYFINRVILNRQTGFDVGSTVNACTKGLWLWNVPQKSQSLEGNSLPYFVVDTEGIAGLEADQTHDLRILTLATLVSSLLIYNSVGAIDESTIEQLGVLAASAKNIQLQDSDAEDLAKYFPSLLWILRDFSLQLTDADGDPISAKEYMEKALQQQRGFSDGIESKNRIRRLMTAFFRSRDCATIVRPVADEYQLQHLQHNDLNSLRPEFFEQVLQIRKRISQMIQPKKVKGQVLTGQAYVSLLREYINQLNQNHRVHIELAWDRVMRDEISRYSGEAYEIFEKCIRENVVPKLPLLKDELKVLYKQAKEQAYNFMNQKCEVPQSLLKDLNKKFKQRIQAIAAQNEKESYNVCQAFVQREFISIQKRLSDYRSILEYERDIKLFYQFLLEHGPKTVLKFQVYQEFYHKMMNDGAQMFIKNLNQDLSQAKMTQDEYLHVAEEKINLLRHEKEREIRELLDRVRALERERVDDQTKIKRLTDQLKDGREGQDQQLKDLRRTLEQERKFSQQQADEHRSRQEEMEHLLKQAERQAFMRESEFNKQRALLEQRLQHIQRQLDEYQKKEQSLDSSIINTKSEYNQQLKEVTNKYEALIQILQDKVQQKVEHCNILQDQILQNDQKFEMSKNRSEQRELQLQNQLAEHVATNQKLKMDLQERMIQDRSYKEEFRERYENEIQQLSELCSRLETQLREKQDKYLSLRQSIEKDRAMLQQRVQFLEVENEDLKQQLTTLKRSHEHTIQILETSKAELNKQGFNKQVLEIKEAHIQEVKNLEIEHEHQKRKLYTQIDQLSAELNENDLRASMQINEMSKELHILRTKVQTLEDQKARLQSQNQLSDQQRSKLLKDAEDRINQKTKQYEQEIEDQRKKYGNDMRDLQQKHEEQMLQLRNVYELEKDRLERRVIEERDNNEKRYTVALEEMEQRHQEEQAQNEEDINQLKNEIQSQEMQINNLSQHFSNEIEQRDRIIKELELINQDLKITLQKQQEQIIQQTDMQMQVFNQEKRELTQLIDQLEKELRSKEQELNMHIQKRNQLEDMYHSRDLSFEGQRAEWQNERAQLLKKIDDLKKRNDEMQDGFLQRKMVLEKNVALSQQQNFFLNTRVEELQQTLDQLNAKHEQNLRQQMKEQTDDFSEKFKRVLDEKQDLQQRYEKLRLMLKDTEAQATRVATELEKENNMLHEQLLDAEKRINELDAQYQSDLNSLNMQLSSYRDSNQIDKNPLYAEIERLKSMLIEQEGDKLELQTTYEREFTLWQGKFKFLEEQRDQAKQDLSDAMLKFEQTLGYLQKARLSDKVEEENSLSEMLIAVEKKYQLQLLDLTQTHEQRILEVDERARYLERELKALQERTALDAHGRVGRSFINEKKMADLIETEEQLKDELEQAHQYNQAQAQEFLMKMEDMQSQYRQKLNEAEERYKELEKRRSTMIFEHEKEKAKWALERDHLQQKMNEIQDNYYQAERRRENATKENEKLRSENKQIKRTSNHNTTTRRSPNRSPIETNRSSVSNYATSFVNRLSGYEKFDAQQTSFEGVRSQVFYDGDDSFLQLQPLQDKNSLPAESFEAYYALMKERQ